ncbi:MAG: ABC transporter permease subunit [Candidatus Dadabacteria bacterium]|nr:ABC transporter permease [Candidatus Dadabacteria bacterium]NIV41577.1 ABC transporter permease subunit [Candidatus Dadabacteria bacterium]NIX15139.1 ABC transporter permease subunit [Candidatus Dadabacteria bacterium]NIY21784.1 ABC transporter permease subunit [Candidatus Dadabacteria bacterium]
MLNRISVIAYNTFIEAVRDRILYSLVLFSFLMILGSIIITSISAEQYNKIVRDIGLTTISLIGILISIFLGMNVVYKEIEKKTVYNIFSKPVRRFEFILGKYFGISFTLLVITVSMSLILSLIVLYYESKYQSFIHFYYGGSFYSQYIAAIYFTYLEFLVVIAISLVFSSFSTPVMTVLFVLLAFVVGRFSADIKLFADFVKDPFVGYVSEILYRIIPHLDQFNLRSEAVHGGEISSSLIINTSGYAVLYCLALLILSIVIFEKKEFK